MNISLNVHKREGRVSTMLCKKTVRKKIVAAAKERFLHYGYGKTTMAEVAGDCNMSPGNLYRYFASKLDMAVEIAEESAEETLVRLRQAARQKDKSATERLTDFLFELLRSTWARLEEDPKIFEMAQIIAHERPEFANKQLALQRSVMAEILAAGNSQGEFDIPDVMVCSEMIQCATMKFKYPQLWSRLPLHKLEEELSGVISLLLSGLRHRPDLGMGDVANYDVETAARRVS